MAERKGKPIEQGLVARAARAVAGAIQGATDAWFGPGQPMDPVAPPETKGRQWDFPVNVNVGSVKPRGEQGENTIGFDMLRALADTPMGGLDLLRLAIETRKDQMATQLWDIRKRDGLTDDRCKEIKEKLRRPTPHLSYIQWARMLQEDMFVIDAACVYNEPQAGDKDLVPMPMDGATIRPLIREDGRRPLPPDPAYQQMLKGVPGDTYTMEELLYAMRNPRTHRIYGFGYVEQVITTIQIALRRQLSQMEHYTAGSIPDMILGVPDNWTNDQIRQFQEWWDSILSGNTEEQRRARFVPGGIKPFPVKEGALKDEYDEWIARIICYAFSLSPQAFAKQMNRATAQTAKESAQEEGLEPVKLWWKHDMMDPVLANCFDAADYEFVYIDEEIADPVAKVTVISTLAGKKAIITRNEAREKYGFEPLTPDQEAELDGPAPSEEGGDPLNPDDPNAEPPKPGEEDQQQKVAKVLRDHRGSLRPKSRIRYQGGK